MDITDRIKTFEDAQVATGRTGTPDFSIFPEDMQEHFEALYKMEVIEKSLMKVGNQTGTMMDESIIPGSIWFRRNSLGPAQDMVCIVLWVDTGVVFS